MMEQEPDFVEMLKDEPIITLKAGEVLFNFGDDADCLYIVVKGMIRLGAGQTVFEEASVGAVIGEMAVVDNSPRSATGWAAADTSLLRISASRFRRLIIERPDFALAIMRIMAKRLRAMNKRFLSLESLHTAPRPHMS
ncbi:MAG: Crp/Fnr family transcriptional regulator [Candidatus Symbiobacter sp.]|nr:Crp/Fnr family transcriptional regulator [Candidatus Symbiobacter sp.]